MHLLWDCDFALNCWDSMVPNRRRGTLVYDDSLLLGASLPAEIRLEVIILGCWHIWQQRNVQKHPAIFDFLEDLL